jgi:hypothetical protein
VRAAGLDGPRAPWAAGRAGRGVDEHLERMIGDPATAPHSPVDSPYGRICSENYVPMQRIAMVGANCLRDAAAAVRRHSARNVVARRDVATRPPLRTSKRMPILSSSFTPSRRNHDALQRHVRRRLDGAPESADRDRAIRGACGPHLRTQPSRRRTPRDGQQRAWRRH